MATKTPQPSSATNITAMSPQGFCGDKVTVEFLKVQDQEPRDIFVGVNDYQAQIKRGTRVTIPVEVFEVIQRATYTDLEEDPDRPGGPKIPVEKSRYPYNVIERHAAVAK